MQTVTAIAAGLNAQVITSTLTPTLTPTLTLTPTPTPTPTPTQAEMAAQAAVRLQSAGLALMRSTHAGQDVLDHDAGPMRMQAAARSIQRLYRLGARL